jgi:hypothetical protein
MKDEMGGTLNTVGEMKNTYRILIGNFKVKAYLGDLEADERVILIRVNVRTEFSFLRTGSLGEFCERDDKP